MIVAILGAGVAVAVLMLAGIATRGGTPPAPRAAPLPDDVQSESLPSEVAALEQQDAEFDAMLVLVRANAQEARRRLAVLVGSDVAESASGRSEPAGRDGYASAVIARPAWGGQVASLASAPPLVEDYRQRCQRLQASIRSKTRELAALRQTAETFTQQAEQVRQVISSDVVFVAAAGWAVGIVTDESGRLVRHAVAEGPASRYVAQAAKQARTPCVSSSPNLLVRLARTNSVLGAAIANEVRAAWSPRIYVPPGCDRFVAFHNLNADRSELGFYRSHNDTELQLATPGKQSTTIARRHVKVGSIVLGNADEVLARSPTVDYLDYITLRVGQAMNSPERPVVQRLAVRAKLDLSPTLIDRVAGYRPTRYLHPWLNFVLQSEALAGDRKAGRFQQAREIDLLRNALEDRLVAKLTKMGVPILERENLGELLWEQRMSSSKNRAGLDYSTPEAVDDAIDVGRALNQPLPVSDTGELLSATHVLVLEVGDASTPSSLRFSARLTDSSSGRVVWSDAHERSYRNPATVDDFLLMSGTVMAVNATRSSRRVAGLPLAAPVSGAPRSAVVFFEGKQSGQFMLRNLFSNVPQRASSSSIDRERSFRIKNAEQVPEDNRMRHLMWSVIQAVKPRSGRVAKVIQDPSGRGAKCWVSCLDAQDHFEPGGDLTVIRPAPTAASSFGPQLIRTSFDVRAGEVQRNGFAMECRGPGLNALWEDELELQVGDIVAPRFALQPLVAVIRPRMERPNNEDWDRLGLDAPLRFNDFVDWSSEGATHLSRKLIDSLRQTLTPCLEVADVRQAEQAGATHVVSGRVRPTSGKAFRMNLQVQRLDQSHPATSVRATVGRSQLEEWIP